MFGGSSQTFGRRVRSFVGRPVRRRPVGRGTPTERGKPLRSKKGVASGTTHSTGLGRERSARTRPSRHPSARSTIWRPTPPSRLADCLPSRPTMARSRSTIFENALRQRSRTWRASRRIACEPTPTSAGSSRRRTCSAAWTRKHASDSELIINCVFVAVLG